MAEDEVATIRTLAACRDKMIAHVNENCGRVVDFVGDNMLAEFPSALVEAEKAVIARPSCDLSYVAKANILTYLGRPADAIALAKFAIRIAPVYPPFFPATLAAAYYGSGLYEEAIATAMEALKNDRSNLSALLVLAGANAALDRLE